MKQTLLILSFSDIAQDARVRKQVNLFADRYEVTTCGFGEAVREDIEHLRLDDTVSRRFKYFEAVALRANLYAIANSRHPRNRAALRSLRQRNFDAVIANDFDTAPVARSLADGGKVHVDLHEYFPGLHDQDLSWVRLRKPYIEWVLRRFVAGAASVTTVSEAIANRYREEFGFAAGVVHNAAPFAPLNPTPVDHPIRLVHSGVAQQNRRIEVMMTAAAGAQTNVTLDLYLTGVGSQYHDSLRALAEDLGDRIKVHSPVPQAELVGVLNSYDVGVFILPDTNTNYRLALPNKFFDFVQARLALLISPTSDMERILKEYDLGMASKGVEMDQVVEAFNQLTSEDVARWKQNADAAAGALSAESQEANWLEPIERIMVLGK